MNTLNTLFKFKTINKYLIESLVNPSIYFPTPEKLNDPFDCRLNLEGLLKHSQTTTSGKRKKFLSSILSVPKFNEYWKKEFETIGVGAFSMIKPDDNKSTLLWSHYADEHRGVCLTYKIPRSFLTGKIIGCVNVNYHLEPLTEYLKICPLKPEKFIEGFLRIYLSTKSPAWMYEQEARIILKKHGPLSIPGRFLNAICFGLRASQNDIDLVTKLAQDHCGCRIFSQMKRNEIDFGFTISKLD